MSKNAFKNAIRVNNFLEMRRWENFFGEAVYRAPFKPFCVQRRLTGILQKHQYASLPPLRGA